MNVMNVMVAVDFSDASAVVLRAARGFAERLKARVWLVHVAEPDPDFMGYDSGPATQREAVAVRFRDEHRRLQAEAEAFRKGGVEASALLVQGATAETILAEAGRVSADLIVLGSHGHGAVYKMVVGSVSERVLRTSRRPVLIIPTRETEAG